MPKRRQKGFASKGIIRKEWRRVQCTVKAKPSILTARHRRVKRAQSAVSKIINKCILHRQLRANRLICERCDGVHLRAVPLER